MRLYTQFEQGSEDWNEARLGIPTASEFSRIVAPTAGEGFICLKADGETCGTTHKTAETADKCAKRKKEPGWETKPAPFELAAGHMSYLFELVAERVAGGPKDLKPLWHDPDIERGRIMEPRIRQTYEYLGGVTIEKCGFILSDDQTMGCSPDGVVLAENKKYLGGIECKAPSIETLLGWNERGGGLPPEHKAQVHGSLICSGLPWWDFIGNHELIPEKKIQVRVVPNDYTAQLARLLREFCRKVDDYMAQNGLQPAPRPNKPPVPPIIKIG